MLEFASEYVYVEKGGPDDEDQYHSTTGIPQGY